MKKYVIPILLLIFLFQTANAFTLIECHTENDQCTGYCRTGLCSYIQDPIKGGGYCGCATTTTTTQPYYNCVYDTYYQKCTGTCQRGQSCVEVSRYQCACSTPSTSTTLAGVRQTTTLPTAPTTTTPVPTTLKQTTTTVKYVTVGDLLRNLSFSTTTTTHKIAIVQTTFTIPKVTMQDSDADSVPDLLDNCPSKPNTNQSDVDEDGVGEVCDNCPSHYNASYVMNLGLTIGIVDCDECVEYWHMMMSYSWCYYGCPESAYNPSQADSDGDGVGNACDECPGTPAGSAVNNKGCVPCVDYDKGAVRYNKSHVVEAMSPLSVLYPDECVNETHLRERVCVDGAEKDIIIECPFGCLNGACACFDSDGINYYETGFHPAKQDVVLVNPGLWSAFMNYSIIGLNLSLQESDGDIVLGDAEIFRGKGIKEISGAKERILRNAIKQKNDSEVNFMLGVMANLAMMPVTEYCLDENTVLEYYGAVENDRCVFKNLTYHCDQGCRLGMCLPTTTKNEKNYSMYDEKEVFMISDGDYRTALQLVPLASWDESITVNSVITINYDITLPLLYYHRESDTNWDADAVIHFIQLYAPSRLTVFSNGEGIPPSLQAVLTADHLASQDTISININNFVGPGLDDDQIVSRSMNDYFSYWSKINSVVVCQDDYATGLLAAVWASRLNAPLLFDGNFDYNVLNGRHVYLVGDISAATMNQINNRGKVKHVYSIQSLQEAIVNAYDTNRVILVNPTDWTQSTNEAFTSDKNANPVAHTFYKDSLAAAYLAAAKNEVIIETNSHNWNTIDAFVENEFNNLGINGPGMRYLTIVSAPQSIPMSKADTAAEACGHADWVELDGRFYGTFGANQQHQTIAVGRIFGVTVSDASSMIAKSIFYSQLPKKRQALVVVREDWQGETEHNVANNQTCWDWAVQQCNNQMAGGGAVCTGDDFYGQCPYPREKMVLQNYAYDTFWTADVRDEFPTKNFYSGHTEVANNDVNIKNNWEKAHLILFDDHGYWGGFAGMMSTDHFINNDVYFGPSVVLDLACETCKSNGMDLKDRWKSFCLQNLRRGAVAYMGATDVSYWHRMFDNMLDGIYLDGRTVGEVYVEARNEDFDVNQGNFCGGIQGDPFYGLIGDPTLTPKWW